MQVDVEDPVDAPPTAVWSVISDIEHSGETISSINSIEVLERPNEGLLGLKWRETRTLFGNSATDSLWVTGVLEGAYYTTEARSHGSVYRTDIRVDGAGDRSVLRMRFSADAI